MIRCTEVGAIPAYDWLVLNPNFISLRGDMRFKEVVSRSRAKFEETLKVLQDAKVRGEFPKYLEKPLADLLEKLGIKPAESQ